MSPPVHLVDDPGLRDRPRVFADRTHAGDVLADLVTAHLGEDARPDLLLALPTGGVPIAVELCRVLHVPVDVAIVSRIRPAAIEGGCGAVAWDGSSRVDRDLADRSGLSDEDLAAATADARQRVADRVGRFQPDGAPDVRGRAVLLVDDGLATGTKLGLAVEAVRAGGARSVLVALPTASRGAAERLQREVDLLFVANLRRGPRFAVAEAYRTWDAVDEDDALGQLARIRRAAPSAGSGRTSPSRG